MPTLAETLPSSAGVAAGKYLTFVLGDESYAISVLKVREIIRLTAITAVPQMPDYVKGVINLRGKIIPVLSLRSKFGLPSGRDQQRTCIVVVQLTQSFGAQMQMGLIVDDVEEVVNISASEIEATPDFGAQLDTQYLLGMAKIKGAVKSLLDIDRVIAGATV